MQRHTHPMPPRPPFAVLGLASLCLGAYASYVALWGNAFERGAVNLMLSLATAVAEAPRTFHVGSYL